ncbi:hypothetical protein [Kitasatospora sp. NPDC085464]|uniref:hypothetical protein n=1 Tax=Kitasatospora sp. NPDC085464 TaxID=3364063 RepID=UPI0037C67D7C
MQSLLDAEAEASLIAYAKFLATFNRTLAKSSFRWQNVAELVLAQGRLHTPAPLPGHIDLLQPRRCFLNSAWTAAEHHLLYVEGWAVPAGFNLQLEHAWCVTPDGTVVDPTWEVPGTAYFGVPILDRDLWPGLAGCEATLFDIDYMTDLLHDGLPEGAVADIGRRPPA